MRNYTGLKFNKLTLISDVGPGGGDRGRLWLASCDCGNVVEVVAKNVKAGRVRSCTKCPEGLTERRGGYRARSADEARVRRLLQRTARRALREGTVFALSLRDIQGIDLNRCTICGQKPVIGSLALEFVDPAQGYTGPNTKAVCGPCKQHMAGSNLVEFLGYLQTVYDHLNST